MGFPSHAIIVGANAGSASGFELDRGALPTGFELFPLFGKSVHRGSPRGVFLDDGALLVNGPASIGRFDHKLDHVPALLRAHDTLSTN